jgi:hypothetical protein
MTTDSPGKWNPRQTFLAVVVAVAVGIVGGGSIYAATNDAAPAAHVRSEDGNGPGGFGPPSPLPGSIGH